MPRATTRSASARRRPMSAGSSVRSRRSSAAATAASAGDDRFVGERSAQDSFNDMTETAMSVTYAAFAESEHRKRLARARAILEHNGIACCISVAPEHLYYFAGYDSWVSVNSPQALIFSCDADEPTLVVRNVDLALPRETSWISDIRSYHLHADDVAALIAGIVAQKGFRGGRIAIETQSYALPHALGLALAASLAPAELIDATEILGSTRLVKSPRELAYLRTAAGYASAGLDAARLALKPCITEIALAAAIEGAMRDAGSDYWS